MFNLFPLTLYFYPRLVLFVEFALLFHALGFPKNLSFLFLFVGAGLN